jgi:hypothetical protein
MQSGFGLLPIVSLDDGRDLLYQLGSGPQVCGLFRCIGNRIPNTGEEKW